MDYSVIENYLSRVAESRVYDAPVWKSAQGGAPAISYLDGGMLAALYSLYRRTGDKKYLNYLDGYFDFYVGDDGAIVGYNQENYDIRDVGQGRALFDLYRETGKIKYKKAIDLLYNQLLRQQRTDFGNFGNNKTYPLQVTLEGLYAAMPFYTRYESEFNRGRNYADIVKQLRNIYAYAYDSYKKLYHSGWDTSNTAFWCDPETGLSKAVLLRSTGWYLAALADTISYFDMSAPDLKAELITIFRKSAEGLEQYIDAAKNTLCQVPDRNGEEGNFFEASGNLLIAYALMKGARLGYTDRRFAEIGENVFNAVCGEYLSETEDGNLQLDGISIADLPVADDDRRKDGTYEYYVCEPLVKNDALGIVPLVLAYSEIKTLKK